MCTKREYYECLIRLAMHPKKPALTDVMLETLSIIAYKQPVTKAEIEKIRGVKCDHAINKLVEYELVKELGRLDAPGKPILFGTTEEFLRCFGVQGLEELPAVDPVKLEDFKAEAEEEAQLRLDVLERKDLRAYTLCSSSLWQKYISLSAGRPQKDHPQKPESFQNRSPWPGYTILLYDQTDCYRNRNRNASRRWCSFF